MRIELRAALTDALVVALAVAVVTLPVLLRDGWPSNHELVSAFERAEAFRRAFAESVWWPVWTPFCHDGHGSPFPLFYHRLFSTVSGALALALGSVRGVAAAVVLALALGAWGVRAAASRAGASRWFALAAALTWLVCPYTLMLWVVRGAFAELSAAALVPWLVLEIVHLLEGKPRLVRLALLAVLLFHAHMLIAYLMALTIVLALAIALASKRVAWRDLVSARAAASVLIVAAGTLPTLIVGSRAMGDFATDLLVAPQWSVEQHFHVVELFVDERYAWGASVNGLGYELNRFLLVVAAWATVVCAQARVSLRAVWPLAALLGFVVVLMTPLATPLYRTLPRLEFVQFPWRALSLATPLLVVVTALLLERLRDVRPRLAVALMAAALLATSTFALRTLRCAYPWIPSAVLHDVVTNLNGPPSIGEYLPRGLVVTRAHGAGAIVDAATREPVTQGVPAVRLEGCAPAPGDDSVPHGFAANGLVLQLDAGERCTVTIRQFHSRLLDIHVDNVDNGEVRSRTGDRAIVVEARGNARITVRPRHFLDLLFRWR